jgi:hypothetical protein
LVEGDTEGDNGKYVFNGLEIFDEKPDGHSLCILKNGVVPADSWIRFKGTSLPRSIDCGELK